MATASKIPCFRWLQFNHTKSFNVTHKPHRLRYLSDGKIHRLRMLCYRPFTSGSSYSANDCPHRNFAKNYPGVSRKVLAVPPISSLDFSSGNGKFIGNEDSFEKYLEWRGWEIDKILSECQVESDLAKPAVGLLSHPLTFPLTLGKFFSNPLKESDVNENAENENGIDLRRKIRLCCVGARAECTLPDDYWREFIVMAITECNLNTKNHKHSAPTNSEPIQWTIDFVGPDVPHHLKAKTISLAMGNSALEKHTLTMNYHTAYLHEIVLKFLKSLRATNNKTDFQSSDRPEQIRQLWNGFVLFNPGLGHPNLAKQWKPTLKFLLGTNKPILFTAHSENDANRDSLVLQELLMSESQSRQSQQGIEKYKINPYASRMEFVDPFSSGEADVGDVNIVRPNHSVFILH